MRYSSAAARNAVSSAAHAIVSAIVFDVMADIERRAIDPLDAHDAITSAVEVALADKSTHWVCACGLPDAGEDPVAHSGAETWQDALAGRAYWNLSEAVESDPQLRAAIASARAKVA